AWTLHSIVDATDNLKLSGSFRTRYEAIDGQPRPGLDSSQDLLTFRTTLFAEYTWNNLRIGGELYDSRAYSSEAGSGVSTGEVNAFEPVQAYVAVDFKDSLGEGTSVSAQAGRFTLNLGSRRLVAADDYRNTTNGYTGLRVDVKRAGGPSASLIYTLPQRRLPDDLPSVLDNDIELDEESSALKLWGGIVTLPSAIGRSALELSYFNLREKDQPDLATRNRQLHTWSARLFKDSAPGTWDYDLEGMYQTGSIRASTAENAEVLDVNAYFYHLEVGYQGSGAWTPRFSVEYDEASGDDSSRHYGRFDTLFGMRRGDLAPSGIYAAVARANIRAPGLRLEVTPSSRLDAFVSYKALWLESRTDSFSSSGVRDPTGRSGNFAGHQLDTRLRYWLIPKMLRFEGDVVLLFKGRFLEAAPNAPRTGDTHYYSLNLTMSI
ncbi:MAG TPA: alginate export family protein, partial [Steroidobacteraceae bacterium]